MPRVKVPAFLSRSNASHRKGAKHRTALLATVALLAGMIPAALVFNAASAGADGGAPTIQSDFADYNPGQTVTLTGANWDSASSSQVHIVVNDSDGFTWQHTADVSPAADGTIQDVFKLSTSFISHYSVEASQLAADGTTVLKASSSFTDANSSASLDQCANDPFPSPSTDGCSASASDWVNGNLGASKANYFEGDSIPYRLTFGNLSLSSHTVTIEWDTTKSDTHALDYLTTFNRSVATANPCLGVSPCTSPTTFPIPADPQVTGAGVTPAAGNFTFYGGTINSVSAYSGGAGFPIGDLSRRITLTFTATQANPVLAWGGHISTRHDWGNNNSAVAIPGSPYHTRLIELDGSGGNQDRSLSADAVIFPGSITVIKDATPNGSTSFSFTGSPAPLTNFNLVDDGTSANTKSFSNITTFQTYTVNETPIPAGWGFDSASCTVTSPNGGSYSTSTTTTNVAMKEGENWTCTYLDHQQTGKLIVKKHVVNDNGGTATAGDWSLHVKSGSNDVAGSPQPGDENGTTYTLPVGTYTVSEAGGPAGYTFDGFSLDCDSSGSVTVVEGQTKTCTLTNNDQAAKLIVIKHVINDNGGTAQAKDFTLDSGGTNDSPDNFAGAEAPGTTVTLDAGSYNVTETGPTGYAASFSADCTGTIALGQTKTCTVTNNDQAATLIVIKHVINDNGGTAVAKDFAMSTAGTNANPADGFPGAESPGTTVTLDAGSYNVTESGPTGYAASFSANCSGSIAVGQTKTCTVTNDDIAPKLIVIKHVINDNGGTAQASDFTLDSGGTNDSPDNFAGAESPGTTVTLDEGSYNVTESGPAGYSSSFSADCSGSIAVGQTKTCTVTNDDIAPKLIVIKHVINDNGGTAQASDFKLDSGGTNDSPDDFAGAESPGTTVTLDAGSYDVAESGPAGYAASFSADCLGTIAVGQTKTCTVTNNDIAPKLIVIKHVINDNGGTAVAKDFAMSTGGTNANPADGFDGAESPGTTVTLDAGSYNVAESGPTGYAASFSTDCTGTIAVGQTKTCTVTNNDQAAKLIVIKHVINDNGGTAVAGDFKLDSGGTNDSPDDFAGAESPGTTVTLDAGSYDVAESGPAGYAASFSADCIGTIAVGQTKTCTVTNNDIAPKLIVIKHVINDNGGTAQAKDFTLDSGGTNDSPDNFAGAEAPGTTVTLDAGSYNVTETGPTGYAASFSTDCTGTIAVGQTKTCTVTNDDKPGTIIIKKITKPANTGSFGFTTTGTGYNGFTLPGGGQNSQTLNAGTYTVKEGTQLGWILTGIGQDPADPNAPYSCAVTGSGGSTGVGDLNTLTATITLKIGDTVTCTFENTGQGVTRTQGFWATHTPLASIAWFGGTAFGHTFPGVAGTAGIGDTLICGRNIDTLGKLMGGFWSDVSKTSTGAKRSTLDQARMQLLQQLLSAELNASAFGSVPSSGTFAAWESAYCGTNTNTIKNAQQQAASFNTQGDSSTFTPGTSADSKNARAIANISFWDVLP